jgi:hypothetical protein
MSVRFCKRLRDAIADEKKAPADYAKLIWAGGGIINTESAVEIASIAKQEQRHHKTLTGLRRKYCGGK